MPKTKKKNLTSPLISTTKWKQTKISSSFRHAFHTTALSGSSAQAKTVETVSQGEKVESESEAKTVESESEVLTDKQQAVKIFTCALCGKDFRRKRTLIVHLRRHGDGKDRKKTAQQSQRKTTKSGQRSQKFRKEWVEKYEWLAESSFRNSSVVCKVCNKELNCAKDGVTALKRHSLSAKHIERSKMVASLGTDPLPKHTVSTLTTSTRKARKAEIMIAQFIAQNDLSFALSDALTAFIKKIDLDENAKKKLKCNRSKFTAIICNVSGKFVFTKLINILRHQKFSLIIDESTDISSSKNLALTVRYRDEDYKVHDQFLALLEVPQATSEKLFNAITGFFKDHDVPYKENLIGFAADGASVMFGEKNSVAQRLKAEIPHLFTMKCICHSLALAVTYACKVLPSELNTLLTDVCRYLKYSAKRQDNLCKFQVSLDLPEHKMLRHHKIRWLSLGSVVSRFLEQYDALYVYFEEERKSKIKKMADEAQHIFSTLQNHFNHLYIHFLNFILPLINKRNLEFQCEKPKIHELYMKMESLFKTIASYYLEESYVDRTDPDLLAYTEEKKLGNEHHWTTLRLIELGPTVTADLACFPSTIAVSKIDDFRKICRSFYISLCQQIHMRFPFSQLNVMMMKKLAFLDPQQLKTYKNITEVAVFFGFDHEAIHREYKLLQRSHILEKETDISKFWKAVGERQYANGEPEFPLLMKLVEVLMVLPHSSATVERIFSSINLNKTKSRNRMSTDSLAGILHTKVLGLRDVKEREYTEMISLMNVDMYK